MIYNHADFSTYRGRIEDGEFFERFLDERSLSLDGFQRFIWHLNEFLPSEENDAKNFVLYKRSF